MEEKTHTTQVPKFTDSRRFWLATFLIASGVALIFIGVFLNAAAGMVLGGAGEMFVLAGGILGVDVYVSDKVKAIVDSTLSERKPETPSK